MSGVPAGRAVTALQLAFSLLSRLPVGVPAEDEADVTRGPPPGGDATRYFPVVGAALAIVAFGALYAGSWLFDTRIGCLAAVVALTLATGALHLDGLADCIDGLAVNGNASRRLQAMHDPRIGGVAAVGIVLWLLFKLALLLRSVDEGTVAHAIWCSLIVARAPLAFELREGEPATPDRGLYAWLHPEVRRSDWVIALLFAAALVAPPLVPLGPLFVRAAIGTIAGIAATGVWHLTWYRRVGGLTGDVLGGAVEIREMAMLAAMGTSFL